MKVTAKDGYLTVRLDDGRRATVKHNQTASGYSEHTAKAIDAATKIAYKQRVPLKRALLNRQMEPLSAALARELSALDLQVTQTLIAYQRALREEHPFKLGDFFINTHGEIAKVTSLEVRGRNVVTRIMTQGTVGEFNGSFAHLGTGRWDVYHSYKGPTPKPTRKRAPKPSPKQETTNG